MQTDTTRFTIESVIVEIVPDPDPDTSWRDTEQQELYNEGRLCFVGVQAVCKLRGPSGCQQEFISAGLWGIDDDSGREYFALVARDELNALAMDVAAIGCDMSEWQSLANEAIENI